MKVRGCYCEQSEAISVVGMPGWRDCFIALLFAMTPQIRRDRVLVSPRLFRYRQVTLLVSCRRRLVPHVPLVP